MKNKNTIVTHEHPGRPRYEMKYPKAAEWTFTQLMRVNGVNTEKGSKDFGKGANCTMLTLRKNLDHVMYVCGADGKIKQPKKLSAHSFVVPVTGVTAEPDSESGLGRRAKLFRLRSVAAKDHSLDKAPRKARKVNSEVAEVIAAAQEIIATETAIQIAPAAPVVAPVIPTVPTPSVPVQTSETVIVTDAPEVAHNTPIEAATEIVQTGIVDNTGTPPATSTLPMVEVVSPASEKAQA